jgi:2-keto-4-pentenoate hydratase/2-oxohepta-3-ene-1,7-dioic acid hydratase in catechol pathway
MLDTMPSSAVQAGRLDPARPDIARRDPVKIARFDAGEGARLGLVDGDGIIDIAAAGAGYDSIEAVIAGGAAALAAIAAACNGRPLDHALSAVRLLAPMPKPGKYLAIGMNYQKHLEESERIGAGSPKQQLWFNKQTTCINDPFGVIEPGVTEKLDYEVELGLVIGKRAKGVKAAEALDYVFGYFVANDVSARDWQFHTQTFTMGKSFDTHGPIGPWIVTADEVSDPQALGLRCIVNGEERQSSNTGLMIYPIDKQIEYLSTAFTLEPGDLIATGTPEGVGVGMEPPVFLKAGDVVRCEVDSIGVIENQVAG